MAFKSISGKQALPNGTRVKYNLSPGLDNPIIANGLDILSNLPGGKKTNTDTLKGKGKIVGIGSELPVLGFMYIIECDEKISEVYPYTSFVCPEVYLEQI
jgi:hypothetical protein